MSNNIRGKEVIYDYRTIGSPEKIDCPGSYPKADFTKWMDKKIVVFGVTFETISDAMIQLSGLETNLILDDIQKYVEKVPPAFLNAGNFGFQPGATCLALYDDGLWYRAKVLESHDDKLKVFFVDYGNTEEVLKTNATICPPEFSCFVEGISLCALSGFTGEETQEELDMLKDFIEGKDFVASINSIDHEIHGKKRILLTPFANRGVELIPLKLHFQSKLERKKAKSLVATPPVVAPVKVQEEISVDVKATAITENLMPSVSPTLPKPLTEITSEVVVAKSEDHCDGLLLIAPRSPGPKTVMNNVAVVADISKDSAETNDDEDFQSKFKEIEKQMNEKILEQEKRIAKLTSVNNDLVTELNDHKEEIHRLKAELVQKDLDEAEQKLKQAQKDEEQRVLQAEMTHNFDEHARAQKEEWELKFQRADHMVKELELRKNAELSEMEEKLKAEEQMRMCVQLEREDMCRQLNECRAALKQPKAEAEESPVTVDNFTSTELFIPSNDNSTVEETTATVEYETRLAERNGIILQLNKAIETLVLSHHKECASLCFALKEKHAQ